jgi:hypothetical protein
MLRRTPFQQIPLFTRPACRLNRTQQLTLTTWRWARRTLADTLRPTDLLPQVAIEAIRAVLADVADPIVLFKRHVDAAPEFALVSSLVTDPAVCYDVLDAGFLLRWEELTAPGRSRGASAAPAAPRCPGAGTVTDPRGRL